MQLHASLYRKARPTPAYEFREESRAFWERVWQAEKGDLEELVKYAESIGKVDPAGWVRELHLFLFYVYPGESWLLRYPEDGFPEKTAQGRKRSFLKYLRDVADEHEKEPYPRSWYTKRGCTHSQFVGWLQFRGAEDDASEYDLVAELDAHSPYLGTHLREIYDLMNHPSMKEDLEHVRSGLERLASTAASRFGVRGVRT